MQITEVSDFTSKIWQVKVTQLTRSYLGKNSGMVFQNVLVHVAPPHGGHAQVNVKFPVFVIFSLCF